MSIIRYIWPPVVFDSTAPAGYRNRTTLADGSRVEIVGVARPAAPPPSTAAPTDAYDAAPASASSGPGPFMGYGPSTPEMDYVLQQHTSAPALVRRVFQDLGPIDAQGRPVYGITLWWFLAQLQPPSLSPNPVREQLVRLLDEPVANRQAIIALSEQILQQVERSLMDPYVHSNIHRFAATPDRQVYMAQRQMLSRMVRAARGTLAKWSSNANFLGNDFFMVRLQPQVELTSRTPANRDGSAGPYRTLDDQIAHVQWPLTKRVAELQGDTPPPKPTFRVLVDREQSIHDLAEKLDGTAEMRRTVQTHGRQIAAMLGLSAGALRTAVQEAQPTTVPNSLIAAKALALEIDGAPRVIALFDRFNSLLGVSQDGESATEIAPERDDYFIDRIKVAGPGIAGVITEMDALLGGSQDALVGARYLEFGTYVEVSVPHGVSAERAMRIVMPADMARGDATVYFSERNEIVDLQYVRDGRTVALADLHQLQEVTDARLMPIHPGSYFIEGTPTESWINGPTRELAKVSYNLSIDAARDADLVGTFGSKPVVFKSTGPDTWAASVEIGVHTITDASILKKMGPATNWYPRPEFLQSVPVKANLVLTKTSSGVSASMDWSLNPYSRYAKPTNDYEASLAASFAQQGSLSNVALKAEHQATRGPLPNSFIVAGAVRGYVTWRNPHPNAQNQSTKHEGDAPTVHVRSNFTVTRGSDGFLYMQGFADGAVGYAANPSFKKQRLTVQQSDDLSGGALPLAVQGSDPRVIPPKPPSPDIGFGRGLNYGRALLEERQRSDSFDTGHLDGVVRLPGVSTINGRDQRFEATLGGLALSFKRETPQQTRQVQLAAKVIKDQTTYRESWYQWSESFTINVKDSVLSSKGAEEACLALQAALTQASHARATQALMALGNTLFELEPKVHERLASMVRQAANLGWTDVAGRLTAFCNAAGVEISPAWGEVVLNTYRARIDVLLQPAAKPASLSTSHRWSERVLTRVLNAEDLSADYRDHVLARASTPNGPKYLEEGVLRRAAQAIKGGYRWSAPVVSQVLAESGLPESFRMEIIERAKKLAVEPRLSKRDLEGGAQEILDQYNQLQVDPRRASWSLVAVVHEREHPLYEYRSADGKKLLASGMLDPSASAEPPSAWHQVGSYQHDSGATFYEYRAADGIFILTTETMASMASS